MAELDTIPQETKEQAGRLDAADLVIALPFCGGAEALESAIAELRSVLPELGTDRKALVIHPEGAGLAEKGDGSIQLLPYALSPIDWTDTQIRSDTLRSLCLISKQVGAQVCAVWNSKPERARESQIALLVRPVLNHGYDLTMPHYAHRKFAGLINSSIVYPLTQALYGNRIHYPMASELAFSSRLMDLSLQPEGSNRQPSLAWIASKASCAGLQICQANLGTPPPPRDPADLSATLAQVLGSLFLDMDSNAACWQRSRHSQAVRTFGEVQTVAEESPVVDVRKMIDTFERACRDLLDVWRVILSPATLIDLKKLTKLPPDQFRLPDELWVRLVYDFALGHRQRVMNRDHLLRALTPAYLAWVASYALEVQNHESGPVEERLERLALAFEANKAYLVSQWRWPDRFKP